MLSLGSRIFTCNFVCRTDIDHCKRRWLSKISVFVRYHSTRLEALVHDVHDVLDVLDVLDALLDLMDGMDKT